MTLPRGRLREPLDTLIAADAIVTADDDVEVEVDWLEPTCRGLRRAARRWGCPNACARAPAMLAVAGIASPQRFFDDLRASGCTLARTLAFRDHHPYSRRDVQRIFADGDGPPGPTPC